MGHPLEKELLEQINLNLAGELMLCQELNLAGELMLCQELLVRKLLDPGKVVTEL
jgi:hypothetical protein